MVGEKKGEEGMIKDNEGLKCSKSSTYTYENVKQ